MSKDSEQSLVKEYSPLATAAGIGSMLGSGCIVGLSATIPVWQKGLELSSAQVGNCVWRINVCHRFWIIICWENQSSFRIDSFI